MSSVAICNDASCIRARLSQIESDGNAWVDAGCWCFTLEQSFCKCLLFTLGGDDDDDDEFHVH